MKRIVITLPEFTRDEPHRICAMLRHGATRVHIRKPGCTETSMRALLDAIAPEYRRQISLHDCLHLATEYCIGGVHLNSRCSKVPEGFNGVVSRSCHSLLQLSAARAEGCDYTFLSPVFDSISKPGYTTPFTTEELAGAAAAGIIDSTVFALGGVTPSRFSLLDSLGFGGAALLGAAWHPVDLRKFRLQFITPDAGADELLPLVAKVLEGGCRWVQLRLKNSTESEIVATGREISALCRKAGATFILDDHVRLAEAAGADGVHLGTNDMPVPDARRILGPGYIIGATANTAEHIRRAAADGADYIGLGPLRFTTTKKNLSPVLGYDGYRSIIGECRKESGLRLPIVAIGGITPHDIQPLHDSGADGIAVSGAISNSPAPVDATVEFINEVAASYLKI